MLNLVEISSASPLRFLFLQLVMNSIRNYHATSLFSGSVVMEKSKQEQLNQSGQLASQPPMISEVVKHRTSTSKSRSKSRSPGRSIEGSSASAGGPGSSGRGSRPCSLHASREHSPDNISGTYFGLYSFYLLLSASCLQLTAPSSVFKRRCFLFFDILTFFHMPNRGTKQKLFCHFKIVS